LYIRGRKWQEAGEDCIMKRFIICSPNIPKVIKLKIMKWEGHVGHMGEMRNSYKILAKKPEGKRTL
jgi:hypothetical protein